VHRAPTSTVNQGPFSESEISRKTSPARPPLAPILRRQAHPLVYIQVTLGRGARLVCSVARTRCQLAHGVPPSAQSHGAGTLPHPLIRGSVRWGRFARPDCGQIAGCKSPRPMGSKLNSCRAVAARPLPMVSHHRSAHTNADCWGWPSSPLRSHISFRGGEGTTGAGAGRGTPPPSRPARASGCKQRVSRG